MTEQAKRTWWWIGVLKRRRYERFCTQFGGLDEALLEMSPEVLQAHGYKPDTIKRVFSRLEHFEPERLQKDMERLGLGLLCLEDGAYPPLLRELPDAPVFLSYRGDLGCLLDPLVGLVGTREMSEEGRRITEGLVPGMVRAGFTTVSGLALGIDALVAEETLAAGGRTIAVLGSGLSRIFPPSNTELADRIVKQGGLLLSEFPLDQSPDHFTFPARNRIIAGLSPLTVVCEAPEKSGAIITANLALQYNREVCAVPGSVFHPNFVGCNKLIASGQAQLVTSASDVLQILGAEVSEEQSIREYEPQTTQERTLLNTLSPLAQDTDLILAKTALSAAELGSLLTLFELMGIAKSTEDGKWIRC